MTADRKRLWAVALAVLSIGLARLAIADDVGPAPAAAKLLQNAPTLVSNLAFERLNDPSLGDAAASGETRKWLRHALQDPDTLNAVLRSFIESDPSGPLGFLNDLGIAFKYFDGDANDTNPGLGFSYAYAKQIADWDLVGQHCAEVCTQTGLDLDFRAAGNVAFDQHKNPADFLDTKLAFGIFGSRGGARKVTPEFQQKFADLSVQLAQAKTQPEVDAVALQLINLTSSALTNQVYADFKLEGHFESNQDFSDKQYVFATRVGLDVKGWEKSDAKQYSETSWLAKANVFDYPFAATRWLTASGDCATGVTRCFVPRGVAIPTVALGIGIVNPVDPDPRFLAGDGSSFFRFNAEVSFKTPAFRARGENIYFGADYRFYQELNAKSSVRAAGLDQFNYFVATLGQADGVFVSYTAGQLPFDQKNQQVFEVGIRANIEAIKAFFQ